MPRLTRAHPANPSIASLWLECRVRIGPDERFDGVPAIAWAFHIGGCRPAPRWLKDRRGPTLCDEDLIRYRRIVKILTQTDRIRGEIELRLG